MDDREVGTKDVVVGIAASGTTPYVRGALERAMERGARTATPGVRNQLVSLGGRLIPRSVLLPVATRVNRV
jgi:N-acetylmuramic acid 6-phosphate (MurNAc-6-P) etherase